MPDVTRSTKFGFSYISKNYHRNRNTKKSQWRIKIKVEISIFEDAYKEGEKHAWGYCRAGDSLAVIGTSPSSADPVVDLRIAKFNGQENPTCWSGYPADYRRNAQDRPPVPVLQEWQSAGVIAKHEIRRIRNGQKCNLSR